MKQHCVTIVGAGQIVEEFRAIEELGITDVQIYDDTFTWSKKRVMDICTELIDNNIKAERKLEIPKRVRRWWTEHLGGTILLTIRYGNKVIEFEKGKNAIELSSKAEIEPTLQSIKTAVDNGEFDRLLEEQLVYGSRLTKQ